jgi:hypothetical protein
VLKAETYPAFADGDRDNSKQLGATIPLVSRTDDTEASSIKDASASRRVSGVEDAGAGEDSAARLRGA